MRIYFASHLPRQESPTIHSVQECPNDCTTLPIKWEALKCVGRGVLKHGCSLKKAKSVAIQSLMTDVHELEHKHKATNEPDIYHAWSFSHSALPCLLDEAQMR